MIRPPTSSTRTDTLFPYTTLFRSSWDLGTGAIDDAAGIAITMATSALLKPLEPKRTIRVVAFANEEQGLWGGRAYAEKHADEVTKHVISAESDFGAGRIYGFDSSAHASEKAAFDKIASALAPLGIEAIPREGSPEYDSGTTRSVARWVGQGSDSMGSTRRLPDHYKQNNIQTKH